MSDTWRHGQKHYTLEGNVCGLLHYAWKGLIEDVSDYIQHDSMHLACTTVQGKMNIEPRLWFIYAYKVFQTTCSIMGQRFNEWIHIFFACVHVQDTHSFLLIVLHYFTNQQYKAPWSSNTLEPAPEWDPDNPNPGEVTCLIVMLVRNKTVDAIWIQFFFLPKKRQKKNYLETKMYSYRAMLLFQTMLYLNNISKTFFLGFNLFLVHYSCKLAWNAGGLSVIWPKVCPRIWQFNCECQKMFISIKIYNGWGWHIGFWGVLLLPESSASSAAPVTGVVKFVGLLWSILSDAGEGTLGQILHYWTRRVWDASGVLQA